MVNFLFIFSECLANKNAIIGKNMGIKPMFPVTKVPEKMTTHEVFVFEFLVVRGQLE